MKSQDKKKKTNKPAVFVFYLNYLSMCAIFICGFVLSPLWAKIILIAYLSNKFIHSDYYYGILDELYYIK